MKSKSLWGYCSDVESWSGLIHGGMPIKAIEVVVTPEFSARYLESEYDGCFESIREAFRSVHEMSAFPEMRQLLTSLYPQPGDENKTELFYKAKVLESMALLVEKTRSMKEQPAERLPLKDSERIRSVMSYIDDHASRKLQVPDLARAACMSPTKFKKCFRIETGHSVTTYIRKRRVSMAEALLRLPDLTIGQISRAVGYSDPSQFSSVFQRETGMLPSEYREGMRTSS